NDHAVDAVAASSRGQRRAVLALHIAADVWGATMRLPKNLGMILLAGHLYAANFEGESIGEYNASTGAVINSALVPGLTGGVQFLALQPSGATTTLASSISSSVYGQTVTFTATVAPWLPGAGTPTGTVTFMDGSTILGTGTLNGRLPGSARHRGII